MGAGNRVKIGSPQFELQRSREETMFAQAPAHLLRKMGKRCLELFGIGGVFVERMFVADGLGIAAIADVCVEPAACVLTAGLSRQRQAPFAEALLEHLLLQRG